jgi:hypothetical protein
MGKTRHLAGYIGLAVAAVIAVRILVGIAGAYLLGPAAYADVRAGASSLFLVAELFAALVLTAALTRGWRRPGATPAGPRRAGGRRPTTPAKVSQSGRLGKSPSYAASSVPSGPPERLLQAVFLVAVVALALLLAATLWRTGGT